MKKLLSMFLLVAMLMSVVSVAGAVTVDPDDAVPFNIPGASCKDTTTYRDASARAYKWDDSVHAIYVRHWVTGGSSEYTNHFRGRQYQGLSLVNCGAKWCTVGLNVPIQSSNITYGNDYTVAGRGNTNHYDYDGVSSITLHGNMYVNAAN